MTTPDDEIERLFDELVPPIEDDRKRQHYVWRYYLSAWASGGNFWCYRQPENKFFATQPKEIAAETYFYRLQELTQADLKFLNDYIDKATDEGLRKANREHLMLTQLPFKLRAELNNGNLPLGVRTKLEKRLRWAERNLVEQYHSSIETKSQPFLDSLRAGDDTFYRDDAKCADFVYFLAVQYFRTAKMRYGLSDIATHVAGHDQERTADILNQIHATNFGAALYRERKSAKIIFLKNDSPIPFIAGDQPALSLLDPSKTDDVEIYYPLSPKLAIILSKDVTKFPCRDKTVISMEVEHYNYAIYENSSSQIYSNDSDYLRKLVALGKGVLIP